MNRIPTFVLILDLLFTLGLLGLLVPYGRNATSRLEKLVAVAVTTGLRGIVFVLALILWARAFIVLFPTPPTLHP